MMTVRELARQIHVPVQDVMKTLMGLGRSNAPASALAADKVELVTMLLEQPPPDAEEGGAGVREPRKPNRPSPSAESELPSDRK
jgi:hypothetical protein